MPTNEQLEKAMDEVWRACIKHQSGPVLFMDRKTGQIFERVIEEDRRLMHPRLEDFFPTLRMK